MLSAQHRATVSRIKSEIWSDRVSFLQKVLELAEVDESEQPTGKTQALAQEVDTEAAVEAPHPPVDSGCDTDDALERELSFDEQDLKDEEGRYKGLTDKEWDCRAETQKTHLSELEGKAKELEKAQSQVNEAQTALEQRRQEVDDEIKAKNKELKEFREDLERRAREREDAEQRAKKERERLFSLAQDEESLRKQQKIVETEKVEKKAKKLHEKQR